MLKSMTGFGRATYADSQMSLEVEIRSVNNRFLKIQSRMPDRLSGFHAEIETLVRSAVHRGSVYITVRAEFSPEEIVKRIQPEVIERYHQMAQEVKKRFGLSGDVTMDTLLGLPGVLESERDFSPSDPSAWKRLEKPMRAAVRELIRMRVSEGKGIGNDIKKRLKRIKDLVGKIRSRNPKAIRAYALRLRERVNSLLDGGAESFEKGDLAREVALIAEKSDIAEEIQRTESHLKQITSSLKGEATGRRLEFLVQELFREASTMAAKNIDGPIAAMILDLRAEIDKIKEQAQNIE